MLGLPDAIRACLFDLDGVLTDTAAVHRAAWKATFDPVLERHGRPPFTDDDYTEHVDGKPRLDGVRDFLRSRGITPPEGGPEDGADADTIMAIGERKNADVLRRIHDDGVTVFEGSRRYLEAARDAGLRRIVVSSSANTADVLRVTGLDALVEDRVDGVTLQQEGIPGKPAPDSFLAGAARAGVTAEQAAVFEDATSGVEAGRRGAFGYVVGVNRVDDRHADALREHGASTVVADLGELL
ncbi:beta-phosphoglucomutase family hydrolase [Luteipulveratus sp. YIM 133132]|uniref:Beta-phosphoglucomutase n=1 Tax=Luteipulveratus flavus TaxID=3031728 RepID=A0ABT6C7F3_9MICO|nr:MULTISPECIES: beta-phosphoglucomutase family hydrolase [unclassified Luteipulveratus]MDE9365690.1 beta-phosphoglucomutase family hydrolase [Luteipulveratus sp. YIM 133132]MDF8264873.1 beta-phosphoglucomutase family hydrolase [Luteipulveratus sp. YIM 133296]